MNYVVLEEVCDNCLCRNHSYAKLGSHAFVHML
jgi:hypothetical protein